jgi:hypothetical protein
MATALSTLRGYVRDELGEQTAGRWTDAQLNSWLNRGVDYTLGHLHRGKCYSLMRELIKYTTYTLDTGYQEYTFWDVINNAGLEEPENSTNTWFGFVQMNFGNYVCHVASQEEWHRLNATTGEHAPTTYEPWIYFSGYDRTTKYLTYTSGSTSPAFDGELTGNTGGATAQIAIPHPPHSGTFSGGDAAGDFYIYNDSGTFESETLNYLAPKGSASVSDIATITAAASASVHDCPLFQIWPTPATAETVKLWWINKPDAMSAATDTASLPDECDELLILYAAARAWKADRNFDMHAAMWQEYQQELKTKIDNYQEVVFRGL